MVNKIQTLRNLNQKFPRFQLETLLTIVDCIEEDQITSPTTTDPWKITPLTTPVYYNTDNVTCNATDALNTQYPDNANHIGYCKITTCTNNNGDINESELVATDNNGERHVYLNGEECGLEFPPKSKKHPHLCDKTSCNVNILEDEEPEEDNDYEFNTDDNDNDTNTKLNEAIEVIFERPY